jgi:ubiquinone/menaquinone biosynthesis C-methylase UbiE
LSTHDAMRARFAATAERIAALQEKRAAELAEHIRDFVPATGEERALDAGAGTGALAFALAPLVREVVAIELVPELIELGRKRAPANVEFVEGDLEKLGFERASFDLTGTLRTLHHVPRPELVLAELTRVTRPGGLLLVVDQIAPNDPLVALELNQFERARDPSHTRALADVDMRQLFESNNLVLIRAEFEQETREIDPYLDLAGCEGEARDQARALAPPDYTADLGWYLLRRP